MYEYNKQDLFDFVNYLNAETVEKGNELFFKRCPHCDGGNHGDKYTFSVNIENGAFKCFRSSCDYHGHFVELARDYHYKLVDDENRKYRKLPNVKIDSRPAAIKYMESRGIPEAVCKRYKITSRKDDDNVIVFPFYDEQNELQFVKYRKANFDKAKDRNKEWCEKDTKPILFGMAQCEDFERLIITEGQIDSLSVAACGFKNACSVPTGALGFTWLSNCWDWICKFKEVVVFGDCENGKITLVETLEKRLKMPVRCVRQEDYLHEKDANDILRHYGKDAIITAINNAEIRELKFVKRLADCKSVDMASLPKIKTNIREIDRKCGGLLMGHVVLLTGKRGEGKSTFMSQLIAEALRQDNAVFVYSGELPNYHFKNWLDLQIAGTENIRYRINEYGDKEYYLDDEEQEAINRWYYDKAFIFDNGSVSDDEYTGILNVVVDSICRYNIKLVCIDNLMTAMDGGNADVYRQQSDFVKSLEKIAQKYDVAIILVAHPKKYNEKDGFQNDSVSGSADITNAVSFVFNYERCKTGECSSLLTITKNRMNGRLILQDDAVKLFYSESSKRITSDPSYKPVFDCFDGEQKFVEEEIPF